MITAPPPTAGHPPSLFRVDSGSVVGSLLDATTSRSRLAGTSFLLPTKNNKVSEAVRLVLGNKMARIVICPGLWDSCSRSSSFAHFRSRLRILNPTLLPRDPLSFEEGTDFVHLRSMLRSSLRLSSAVERVVAPFGPSSFLLQRRGVRRHSKSQ